MTDFDRYISLTFSCIEKMRLKSSRSWAVFYAPAAGFPEFKIPLKVGPGSGSGLVMKSETFLELGNPATGSCAFTLYTNDCKLIQDGRIHLIGPNIAESSGTRPFGQIIIISGEELTDQDYLNLHNCQYFGDQIEGYMIKSTPGHIWTRVSKTAVQKGFDFEFLGSALIKLVKARIPRASSAEVIFVTSDKSDIMRIGNICGQIDQLYQDIKAAAWKKRGVDIYECAFHGNCGACSDKEICYEVNKISKARTQLRYRAKHSDRIEE